MPRGQFDAMPGAGSFVERINRRQQVLTVGTVNTTHVINGRVYVDVDDYTRTQLFSKCPLMVFGGDPRTFAFFPVIGTPQTDEGQVGLPASGGSSRSEYVREVILVHRGEGKPYAVGMAGHPDMSITDTTEDDPGAADHTLAISKNDIALQNRGAVFVLDSNGAVTLDTTASGARIRAQLADEGGRLRLSRGGEADERILLGDASVGYFGGIEDQINEMRDRIAQLEQMVDSMAAGLTSGVPVAGTPPVAQLIVVPPQSLGPTLSPPFTPADDSLVSSTVELSGKSVAEDGDG